MLCFMPLSISVYLYFKAEMMKQQKAKWPFLKVFIARVSKSDSIRFLTDGSISTSSYSSAYI